MAKRPQKNEIRQFIIHNVADHPNDIANLVTIKFNLTRQTAHRHLSALVECGILQAQGNTRSRTYRLNNLINQSFDLPVTPNLDESQVYINHIMPHLSDIKDNIQRICEHGFTEMLNNVIDHSQADTVKLGVSITAADINLIISDNGVGLFEKIKQAFNLDDHRHAILELSKGKLTTDPDNHSGEGIFFTSRMFDSFSIHSSDLFFVHHLKLQDWLIEDHVEFEQGTAIFMHISLASNRTASSVFDKFTSPDNDYSFTKTHVPITLSTYGQDHLVSRSQAKRILARFEGFEEVLLDFENVNEIGQAFADQIFRVFANNHPQIKFVSINTTKQVEKMIHRVVAARDNS